MYSLASLVMKFKGFFKITSETWTACFLFLRLQVYTGIIEVSKCGLCNFARTLTVHVAIKLYLNHLSWIL